MQFEYSEVRTQEHLDELKMMGFLCVNHILIEVPEDVIVLAKLTMREDDPNFKEMMKFSTSMDISGLCVTPTTRIYAILHKKKEHTQEEKDILKVVSEIYPDDVNLKKQITN